MAKKVKALAMLGLNNIGWIEKDAPVCGPNDALIKPLALAPCTSDVHTVWEGALGDRHNLILGHEGCGEVVEVGSEVKIFKAGDRVLVGAITPDWGSVEAQAGFPSHSGGMLGGWKFSNIKDGMMSEIFHVNEADANLAFLPDGISLPEACMLSDMIPTGFLSAQMASVSLGDTVCVIGIGPVGLMAVAGANLMGASHLFAVGSRPDCARVARLYGATEIINYKNGSIVDQVMKLTDGKGVDKVLIAGGDVNTFDEAVRMLKPGGVVGSVNYLGSGDYIPIPRLEWGVGMGHKFIHSGLMISGRYLLEKYASLILTGKLDVKPMITHTFNGFEKVEDALLLMKDKPADLIKPVVIL